MAVRRNGSDGAVRLVPDRYPMPNVLTLLEVAGLLGGVHPRTVKRRIEKRIGRQAIFRGRNGRLVTTADVVAMLIHNLSICPTCNHPKDWFPEPDDGAEYRKEALGL